MSQRYSCYALRVLCPHPEGGLYFEIHNLKDELPNQERIIQFYLSEGWGQDDIPTPSDINPHDFPKTISEFFKGVIPPRSSYPFVIEFIDMLNEVYCPYDIFADLDVFDDGASFVILLDREDERVLIDMGWSYD